MKRTTDNVTNTFDFLFILLLYYCRDELIQTYLNLFNSTRIYQKKKQKSNVLVSEILFTQKNTGSICVY